MCRDRLKPALAGADSLVRHFVVFVLPAATGRCYTRRDADIALAYRRNMPLHWTAQSNPPLVTIVAEGDVTKADVEEVLAFLVRADLVRWRKLFDARNGQGILTPEDVEAIGVRIREATRTQDVGPLAFVMPTGAEKPELRRMLGLVAAAQRPMRLFRRIAPARRWILRTEA